MTQPKPPLFLARAVYRKRRLRDAARLLPLVGLFLFLLPKFWQAKAVDGAGAARDVVFIFVIWAALIIATAVLSVRLSQPDAADSSRGASDDGAP